MNRLVTALFLSLCIWVLPTSANAQETTYDGVIFDIPVLTVGDLLYSARLQTVPNSNPLQLELFEAYELEWADTRLAANFSNDILFVSHIELWGLSIWADFVHIGDFIFELQAAGVNELGLSTNELGLSLQPIWERLPGEAYDIGVGAHGHVWVTGLDERGGGFGIYNWTDQGWIRYGGSAERIDVDPDGNPWVVNYDGEIYRFIDGIWERLPGDARDIGIGANGSVWVVSSGGVYYWNGIEWISVGGSGSRIDVDPTGTPWIISSSNRIYRLDPGGWTRMPGEAEDIGIGTDGSVWVIGTERFDGTQGIYRWDGYGWNRVSGSGREISVGVFGEPWVTNDWGDIYSSY